MPPGQAWIHLTSLSKVYGNKNGFMITREACAGGAEWRLGRGQREGGSGLPAGRSWDSGNQPGSVEVHVTMRERDISRRPLFLLLCCCPLAKAGAEQAWWLLLEPTEDTAGHLAPNSLDAMREGSPKALRGEPA